MIDLIATRLYSLEKRRSDETCNHNSLSGTLGEQRAGGCHGPIFRTLRTDA
jgi:hypothetical protein